MNSHEIGQMEAEPDQSWLLAQVRGGVREDFCRISLSDPACGLRAGAESRPAQPQLRPRYKWCSACLILPHALLCSFAPGERRDQHGLLRQQEPRQGGGGRCCLLVYCSLHRSTDHGLLLPPVPHHTPARAPALPSGTAVTLQYQCTDRGLQDKYKFECGCRACAEQWATLQEIPRCCALYNTVDLTL